MNKFCLIYLCSLIFLLNIKSTSSKMNYLSDTYITPPIKIFGAIEAGGTKMVCAVIDMFGNIIEQKVIPTTTPEETVSKIIEFFSPFDLSALGMNFLLYRNFWPGRLKSKIFNIWFNFKFSKISLERN